MVNCCVEQALKAESEEMFICVTAQREAFTWAMWDSRGQRGGQVTLAEADCEESARFTSVVELVRVVLRRRPVVFSSSFLKLECCCCCGELVADTAI